MIWKVELQKEAEKDLAKIDRSHAKRILKYLFEKIATDEDPRRFGDGLKSNLSGLWKYRVGNYRVVCNIQESILSVLVIRIGHRREVYKKL